MSSQPNHAASIPSPPEPKVVFNAPFPALPPGESLTFLQPEQMQWRRIIPEMGEQSPRLTIARHVPETGATTLLIWTPPNFHVPRHWHTGNEKHVIVTGTFIFKCDGREVVMKPGAFNFMPARMVHEAWTPPDEECLLFTDVDTFWDINWIDPAPRARKA
jgi:mannose-6-phosphate isomerase-like protein (cupin superfamily)